MKKKIVAAFCLAMVMTVSGAVLTLRKRIPRRNPHHPQLLPMPQMHRAAEIFLRWIRT